MAMVGFCAAAAFTAAAVSGVPATVPPGLSMSITIAPTSGLATAAASAERNVFMPGVYWRPNRRMPLAVCTP
jgi:hypothetical protein